ncbi:MAG: winged helix-turn-helix transcriptional regulator [Erysipelotrichaceae bacterium]|jgi:DNA-binding MarR family transcriptional regulator|nr:winged helix-turn-helix transcriptional regulator [Erysipelotrichaceae bacterium]
MKKKDRQTAVQKMGVVSRLAWEYAREKMDTDGLSNVQSKVCIAIYNDPGLSQDDVARVLGMDKSSIAKLIAKLMDGKYVTRQTNPQDRREYKLYLDERGEKATLELVSYLNEFQERFITSIRAELLDELNDVLNSILEAAEE